MINKSHYRPDVPLRNLHEARCVASPQQIAFFLCILSVFIVALLETRSYSANTSLTEEQVEFFFDSKAICLDFVYMGPARRLPGRGTLSGPRDA